MDMAQETRAADWNDLVMREAAETCPKRGREDCLGAECLFWEYCREADADAA